MQWALLQFHNMHGAISYQTIIMTVNSNKQESTCIDILYCMTWSLLLAAQYHSKMHARMKH